MAWRPTQYLLEGELDNTQPGKVTGWMRFAGMNRKVTFDLKGNFHRDIRGAKIRFKGNGNHDDVKASSYMDGLADRQTGKVGDITAGLPPQDYVSYPYVEAFTDQNGRIVLELAPEQIEVIGTPIPTCESDPISRQEQAANMAEFLVGLATEIGVPAERAVCVGGHDPAPATPRDNPSPGPKGMKLLTKASRKQLPPLYSQDGKGGEAVAYVKFFLGGYTWWATEFDGQDTFFGLVEGHEKELGYFSLSELQSVRGPMGLPAERDLHFHPTKLSEIAPELFAARPQSSA